MILTKAAIIGRADMTQQSISGQADNALNATAQSRSPFKSKTMAALLAALFGVLGVHGWYLGRKKAWLVTLVSCGLFVFAHFYPVWWDSPPFLLLVIPAAAGYIEALVLALQPDERFDARYNRYADRRNDTGWGPVLIAIFTTLMGSSVVLLGIAMAVLHVYRALGWLDGYVY